MDNSDPTSPRQSLTNRTKARRVMFYKSGDANFTGLQVAVTTRRYRSFETLLSELSGKVPLPFGVRSIHTPRARHTIDSVDQLEDGAAYLLSSTRKAKPVHLDQIAKPVAWHNARPLTANRARMLAVRRRSAHSLPENRDLPPGVSPGAASAPPPQYKRPKKITICKNGDPGMKHVILLNRRTAQSYENFLQDISDMFKMQVNMLYTGDGQKVESLSAIFNWPDVVFVAAGREKFKHKHYGPVPHRATKPRSKPRQNDDHKPVRKSRGKYKVTIKTNEMPSAGTDATVSITAYGKKGNSGPLILGGGDGNTFQSGNIDEFTITAGDIGPLYKIRISHDNSAEFAGWLCEEVTLQDIHTDEEFTFPCNKWLSTEEDDGEICRELPVTQYGQPVIPMCKYQVAMVTGDYWNGGTDADVYITMYGEKGDTGPRHLHRSKRSNKFEKGQTDIFSVEAVSLGAIQKVVVGLTDTDPGHGWYLEKVIVMESPDAHDEFVFPCHRWLDEGEDDGKTVRELLLETKPPSVQALEKDMWALEKWKYDRGNTVLLYCKGTSKAVRVKADATVDANGDPDGTDPFSHFEVHRRKGNIRVFRSVMNPSYHLAVDHCKVLGQGKGGAYCEFRVRTHQDRSVSLESVKTPSQFVTFLANGRSGDTRGSSVGPSKQFVTYVKGMLRDAGVVVLHTSRIQVFVSDEDGACSASGKKSQRGYWKIHKVEEGGIRMLENVAFPSKFLRVKDGQCDCLGNGDEYCHFKVTKHKDKGFITLQSLKNRGIYAGFATSGIARPTVDTGERNVRFYPEVVQWGMKKGTDIVPSPRTPPLIIDDEPKKTTYLDGDWKIWLKSGKKGTKAPITFIAYGRKGPSDLLTLGKKGDTIAAGDETEFMINLGTITDMYKIRLGLQEENSWDDSWHLSQVRMQDMVSNEQLKFKVNRWLSRTEDDGDSLRELAVVKPGRKPLPMVRYFVQVYTGDEPGSDTDANVYICIYGDRGDTGKRLLHRSDISDKFQQGQVDSFEIEAISLGKPRKVVISHDGSGPGAGWFCQEVAIRDSKGSKTEYVFQCNKWLDEGLDDKKIERELKLTEIREIEPNDWLVWITTGREDSASTTAKVALYAYGNRSSSDAIVLGSGKDGYFYAGNIDKFKVNIGNIGDMYKIRIGHNNMYDEPAWFLEKVRMRDMNQGTMVTMNVNRWLSREHDDMDVWRELPMALPGKDLLPVLKYFIQVFTADLPKANTKSTIFMNIYGKRGDTGKRVLYKSKNNDEQFNINQVDIFEIEAVHLGELRKVVIGHDGKTPGEGWYLDKIIIKESQDSDNEVYFPCKKWLDRGKEDKKIDRELTPSKPIGEYTVIFTTGGASLDRNDALVCFDVYGEKAHAQPFIFGATKREYFSPDAKDQFEINVGEIGDIYKIRVSHDDHDKWEGWYLKEVRMIDRMKNDEYVYKFNRWLSRDEDDMDIVRELPTERRGKKTLPVLKYFVEVFTGINPNAATKANVYMNIYGKKGDCGKRILYKSHNNDEKFRREQRDVFEIEAVHLMDLKKIIIGHDGKAGGEGWFLDKVIIKESEDADSQWYFPCRKWLDTSKDDRKIERELKPGKPDHEWAVWITTADDSCQRNTAVGHIVMYGDKGKTEMIPLGAARSDKLAPGQSDEFEIQTGKIGKLYKIRIGYEDEDKWDGWHVNEVRMMERSSKEILTFSFDRWMSRSEDDNDIVRELPAVRDGEKTLPVIRYYVEVYTGDLDDASTQSSAYMTLYGKRGDTGVRALYKSMHNEDKFQRGQMDAFEIEAVHLGDIKHIIIGHDGVEPGQGWYVDHVVVKESEYAEQQWYFPCKRWFDVSRDDRKIERQIIPGEREYTPPPTPEPDEGWKLELTTADDSYPSHGAVAYISVYGNKRNSDRIPLSAFDSFTPGKTDKFDVSFEVNLGEIYKIRIEHDDKDKWEGWHLNEIKMRDNSSKEDYLYKFDRWLSRNKDDLDIVRELPTIKDGKDHLPVLKYYVEVFTGREPKAETNANVFMTIYGKKGDSGKRVLYKSMNNDVKFQREQRDVFVIEAVHLMDLKKVVIGHDGKVAGKGWFLDKVIIRESEDSDKDFYFPCRKWLDVGQDDKKIERELKVSKADYEYTVWITTSSESNPRNNALVHLVVYGSKGKSDPILLGSARQQTFSPGNTDEFEIYTGKVGEIYKIRVGYDDDTKWDGWHLSQVRMRDRVTHEYLQFDCNRWMSRTDDDLDIVRELPAERPGKDTLPVLRYHIQVYTSEDDNAGTDAKIYMEVHGERGDTGKRILYKSLNNEKKLQKGQMDIFEIEAVHLGDLKKVIVGHDMIRAGQGWSLDKVIIKEAEDADKEWYFQCKKWLDAGKDDHKIERTLKPSTPDGEWTVWIATAEDSKPRKESPVHLVVYGKNGKTDSILLGDGKPDYFEANTTNEVDINVGSIGQIYKIRIGHENNDNWEGWHLKEVKMRDRKSKEELLFTFDRWMSRTDDDLDIVREMPVIRSGQNTLPVMKYQVQVYTGTVENADTEATCYICIYGERGDTGNRVLYKSLNNEIKFQKGQKDIFEIEAVHLGDLEKVVVGHNGKKSGQGWYIDKVIVRESSDSERGDYFPCNRWLDVSKDDRKVERELKPGSADGEWTLWITTAEDSRPCNNSAVHLVVYGEKDKTDPIILGDGKPDYFEAGTTDEEDIKVKDIGKIFKIRIGYDHGADWDGWHLEKVKMRERKTGEILEYQFDRWMSRTEDDLEIVREFPAIREGEDILPVLKYHIEVNTGTEENADTEATCYMCIYGERGDTGNRVLYKSLNNEIKFQKGQKDIFEIEAVHLGELKKVVVGHHGKEPGQGWFLSDVVIKEAQDAEEEVFFPNNRWLDVGQDDNTIERELLPGQREGEWDITIVTAEDSIPAMEAVVYLVVYGDQGKSDNIPLGDNDTVYFEPGRIDIFERVKLNVGKIYKIRIGHNDIDKWDGWHLQEVRMKERSTEEELIFRFDRWMARNQDDLDVLREMPAIRQDEEVLPIFRYFITVFTGEIENAACEATIYMCIYGERGDTGNRVLFKSLNNENQFQEGQVDMFEIEAVSLGELQKVVVGHDNKEAGQGWFCEKVIVKEAQDSDAEFHFPCSRWLDVGEDDQEIERELLPGKPAEGEWKLVITTHEDSFLPSEALAYLVVYGEDGKTEPIAVGGEPALEPGNLDEFDITLDNVGEIYKIRIGHIDEDEWEGWYLEDVELRDKCSEAVFAFPFNRWMARTKDDFDIVRELPVTKEGQDQLPVFKYQVLVHTGDRWAANTDAKLFLTLYGERGDSGERLLFYSKDHNEKFQKDQIDSFTLEAVSLGELSMVELSHNGVGYGAGVFVDTILVRESEDSENEYVFQCVQWLDDHMEDRQTKRQIKLLGVRPVQKTEAEEDKHKSKGNWKVLVKTCDGENAGTESNVFISVYGKDNKKELIPLNNGEIRPAEEKDFEINVGEIGEIYKIRLEHDNTSEEPAWHVNKVIMEDKDSKEKLTFICNSWLSRDKENCDIYKELPALRSGQDPRPLKSYIIEVHTSDDDDDASTGANVFLTLFGSHGDTGKRQLIKVKPERKSDSDENQEEKKLFQKGQVDSFLIEAVSLGELEKIVVFIDSGEPDNAWLLDKIIVKESEFSKVQWQFACQDWIGKIQVDGMVMSDREIWGVERPVSAPETENETPPDDGESNSQGKWHVWMRTGKDDKMGTTAKTYMMVYGQNGCTDPIPLLKEGESVKEQDEEENKLDEKKQENIKEDKKDVVLRFESGSTEEFDIDVGEIGPLYKIRVYHDNSGEDPSWYLEKVKMKDKDTNQEFHFFANRWLRHPEDLIPDKEGDEEMSSERRDEMKSDKSNGNNLDKNVQDEGDEDNKIEPDVLVELPAIRPDIPPPPVYMYEVGVHTGDKGAASTDTEIYMTLYGEKGDTGRRQLRKSQKHKTKFQRDQIDIFYIEAVDISKPVRVIIGHSEEGYGAGWYLDKITIKETKDSNIMYYLPCNRWFDTAVDDRKTEREVPLLGILSIPAEPKVDPDALKSEREWKIKVMTSNEDGAGTKAMVYLVIYGEEGQQTTEELNDGSLTSPSFDPGNEDEFDRLIDVGKISKIRLLHNNTNPDPRWRVDYLTMEDKHTGEKLEFNFDCWIGVNDGDGTACKEAPALRENDEPLNVHEYVLEVYTGEKDESGTDADVFVIIGGSKGDTGRRDLRKPTTENEEKFQKGQMDAFVIDAVNLGMVGGISVGIDSDDIDKKWYLDKIVLKDSKDEDAKVTEFKCQKWFGDNETFVTFYPEAKLKCVVHSSEKSEGNLNGSKVYVAAFMYSEDTGFTVSDHVVLDNGQDDMFSANKVDEFEANFGAINLMDVYKIRGWLDDDDVQPNEAGQKKCPSLHFKSICMKSDGQEFSYEVNKWLSKTEDDCETVRELPIIRTQPDTLPVSSYLITVFTYEDAESGTDADIYINIIGSLGDTGKRWLCKPISGGEKFDQPGKVDEFTVEAVSLGSLQKITIFKSPGKAWFVDKLVIKEGLAAEQETEFKCVRNLGYDNPDETIEETFDLSEVRESSKIVVPLPEEPTESQGEWKVYVTTNEDENAGTEAKVTFIAYGTEGVSQAYVLGEDKPEKFKPGTIDEFDVILGNIGRIYKIRLQSDNSGKNPSWLLEKIKLKDVHTKEEFCARPMCWLSDEKDNTDLIKEVPAIWPEKKALQLLQYELELFTNSQENAGTDANVYITVFGVNGDTGRRILKRAVDNDDEKDPEEGSDGGGIKFPQGKKKTFIVEAVDLGELSTAIIGHDGNGSEGGWLLDKVIIHDILNDKSWLFNCYKWLSDVEDGTMTETELIAMENPKEGDWKVIVTTKDEEDSGTTSNVTMVVYGENDKSDDIPLGENGDVYFNPGSTDTFDIHLSPDIGKLYKIRVFHDNDGESPSWYLEKIILKDKVTGGEVTFTCERWLSREHDDEEIVRELPAVFAGVEEEEEIEPPPVLKYEVKVETGDVFSAGTDSNIYLNIYGDKGDTGKRDLRKNVENDNKFESGKTDTFLIEAVSLGSLEKVVVGHDGDGAGAGWYLSKIVIKESAESTDESVFKCDRWLAVDEDDGLIERELEIEPDDTLDDAPEEDGDINDV